MLEKIKKLRELTNIGLSDCKAALEESNGDIEQAVIILKKKGQTILSDRSSRTTENGLIHAYIHGGKIGVMLELKCETDFVAKTEEFVNLANDLAMQIASMNPSYVDSSSIPPEKLQQEKDILMEQARNEGKPENIIEKMVEGRLKKFYAQYCLVDQPFIKDDKKKVQDIINSVAAQMKEKIQIRRFVRYKMGSEI